MIRSIQLKHAGKYVCMVQTSVDKLSAAADLIVRGIWILLLLLKNLSLFFSSSFFLLSSAAGKTIPGLRDIHWDPSVL